MEEEVGEGEALRQCVAEEVAKCTDAVLLDLIYKLLVYKE